MTFILSLQHEIDELQAMRDEHIAEHSEAEVRGLREGKWQCGLCDAYLRTLIQMYQHSTKTVICRRDELV